MIGPDFSEDEPEPIKETVTWGQLFFYLALIGFMLYFVWLCAESIDSFYWIGYIVVGGAMLYSMIWFLRKQF